MVDAGLRDCLYRLLRIQHGTAGVGVDWRNVSAPGALHRQCDCVWGNYFANFIIGATFLSMLSAFGASNTFLLFASMAMFALLFVLFFLPETAGRTLEEIERDLGEPSSSGHVRTS